MSELDEVLEHHGVKGMHWGQRRAQKKVEKADRKFEKNAGSTQTFFKIYNAGAHDFNTNKIDAINNKPAYKKAADAGIFLNDNHPMTVKYHKEVQAAFVDSLNKAANSLGTNASGTKHIGVEAGKGDDWNLVLKDVKHADGAIKLKLTKSKKGEITKIEMVEPLAHSDLDEVLEHYGVKGMHWGQRKTVHQIDDVTGARRPVTFNPKKVKVDTNADGSLNLSTKSKRELDRVHKQVFKGKASDDFQKADQAKSIARAAGTKALSNKELQELVTRMNLEQQYSRLQPPPKSKQAAKFLANTLVNVGKQQVVKIASDELGKQVAKALANR